MDKKLKIASIMLYIVSIIIIFFGLVYIFTPGLMPYHEKYLGMTQEQLNPRVVKLFLYMLKGAGASFLSTGITLVIIIKAYYSKGDKLIRWIILIMTLLPLITLFFITLSIGIYTPWWLVLLMIILVITATLQ